MAKAIGIDLGTTNSCVAAMDGKQAAFEGEVLGVADNLRRVIDAADDRPRASGHVILDEGVRATERQLVSVLQRFGVQKIQAIGTNFSPHQHEAVMDTRETAEAAGVVVQVLEDGYTIHGRLLRLACAVVGAAGSNSLPSGGMREDRSV